MSKSVFQPMHPEVNQPRNGFDISSRSLFTSPIGALLPTFYRHVNPGDHIKLGMQSTLRARPMNDAAYIRLKENMEYFFVPYRLLDSYWNSFISQVQDENSSSLFRYASSDSRGTYSYVPNKCVSMSGRNLIETFFHNNGSNFIGNRTDIHGVPLYKNFQRLFNLCGYGDWQVTPAMAQAHPIGDSFYSDHFLGTTDYTFNPFTILAYQKICYDHFRLTDYQNNYPLAFNVDMHRASVAHDASVCNISSPDAIRHIWELHYRPAKKDFFTALEPSVYWFGTPVANSSSPSSGIDAGRTFRLPSSWFASYQVSDGVNVGVLDDRQVGPILGENVGTAAQIRATFALEKLARLQRLIPKHYRDQLEAQFGVSVHAENYESIRIGSFINPIQVGEVVSAADTDGAALGQITGRASASFSSAPSIEFTAKEHGVVMGIYCIVPDQDYNASGVDPFNKKFERSDYYMPVFDNLGPQVVRLDSFKLNSEPSVNNRILGLQKQFLEYKCAVDKVYGSLMTGGVDELWAAPRVPVETGTSLKDDFIFTAKSLLLNPMDFNHVFGLSYDGDYQTDPFIINQYVECHKVSNMSVDSEPRI